MSSCKRRVAIGVLAAIGLVLGACAPAATPVPATPVPATPVPATPVPATPVPAQPTVPATVPPTTVPTSPPQPTAAATEAPFTLTMWWWGEQGIGQEAWVNGAIAGFEKLHPNINVQIVFEGLNDVIPNFTAAAKAQQGPDVATLWYGMYMYPFIWSGDMVPVDKYISKDELSHWSGMAVNYFEGNYQAGNLYTQAQAMSYNKKLFAQAGLDPNKPPQTWDDFMSDCAALKKAGIPCVGMGAKDGWAEGPYMNLFMTQTAGYKDVMQAVVGGRSFTEQPFADMWNRLVELRDKGYINADVSSLDYSTGETLMTAGKAAFAFHASDASASDILKMGDDTIGALAAPSVTGQPLNWYPGTAYAFFITKWSPHPQAAADLIAYFHTQDVLNSAYTQMKGVVLPADDRFDPSVVQDPGIRNIVTLMQAGFKTNKMLFDSLIPDAILENGMNAAFQDIFSTKISAAQAAQMTEDAAKTWREQDPDTLAKYKEWAAGLP